MNNKYSVLLLREAQKTVLNNERTTTRSYSARLQPTNQQRELLVSTQEVYRKGAVAALDILLNLSSTVRPNDNITTTVKTKKKDETSFLWTSAHTCFANWFTLESDTTAEDTIDPKDIKDYFISRWEFHHGGEIPETLMTHIDNLSSRSMRDGSKWIDRYAAGEKFLDQFEIPREQASQLAIHIGWPFILQGDVDGDAANFSNDICSLLWGDDGAKANWNEIFAFYKNAKKHVDQDHFIGRTFRDLVKCLSTPPSRPGPSDELWSLAKLPRHLVSTELLSPQEITEFLDKEIGINPFDAKGSKTIKGLIESYQKLDQVIDLQKIKQLRTKISEKLEDAISRIGLTLDPGWRTNLLNWLSDQCGVPYIVDGSRRLNIYSQFFSLASSALGSWRSNTSNQCSARHEAKIRFDAVKDTRRNVNVERAVNRYKDDKQQTYLRRYQYKSIGDVVKVCHEDELSPREAISRVIKITDDYGDVNLLTLLADTLDYPTFYTAEKTLEVLADIDECLEDVTALFHPVLRHFAGTRTANPWFGDKTKSLPLGIVLPDSTENLFKIRLDLIDPQGNTVPTEIIAASKRFVPEILTRNDDNVSAPRNHHLFALQRGVDELSSNVDITKISISPFLAKNDDFYVYLAVPFAIKTLSTKEIIGLPNLRILGVDRGWRKAAAFAVIQKTTNRFLSRIAIPRPTRKIPKYDSMPPTLVSLKISKKSAMAKLLNYWRDAIDPRQMKRTNFSRQQPEQF